MRQTREELMIEAGKYKKNDPIFQKRSELEKKGREFWAQQQKSQKAKLENWDLLKRTAEQRREFKQNYPKEYNWAIYRTAMDLEEALQKMTPEKIKDYMKEYREAIDEETYKDIQLEIIRLEENRLARQPGKFRITDLQRFLKWTSEERKRHKQENSHEYDLDVHWEVVRLEEKLKDMSLDERAEYVNEYRKTIDEETFDDVVTGIVRRTPEEGPILPESILMERKKKWKTL